MAKVYLVNLNGETFVKGLIGDNKLLKFSINSKFLGEFPISYNINGMQEVDILSILMTKENTEVGYNINQNFGKGLLHKDIGDVVAYINRLNGLIFMGSIDNVVDSIKYNQYIYVFLKGSLNEQQLKGGLGI